MDRTPETLQEPTVSSNKPKSARVVRKKMQRTRSFTDALRDKYCSQETCQSEFIIDIVIRGKPKHNGPTSAELAHLRNVVLSNCRVSTGGLPEMGLSSLCPNVTDLDLSCNLLESWAELLPLVSGLPHLKFLNLSRNHITRHKEELWRWNTPLPKVENMVLNSTGVPLREVLALARLMPALRELHICCNYYRDLGSVELAIKDGALSKLECLRLNENIITSWAEVWKLRNLPCLTHLILSENPLCDVFYCLYSPELEESIFEMDSPDITCHSDGEDSSCFGSPHFRYPVMKMAEMSGRTSSGTTTTTTTTTTVTVIDNNVSGSNPPPPSSPSSSSYSSHKRYTEMQSAPQLTSYHNAKTAQNENPTATSVTTATTNSTATTRNTTTAAASARDRCHMIHDLIDDLINTVCRSAVIVQESGVEGFKDRDGGGVGGGGGGEGKKVEGFSPLLGDCHFGGRDNGSDAACDASSSSSTTAVGGGGDSGVPCGGSSRGNCHNDDDDDDDDDDDGDDNKDGDGDDNDDRGGGDGDCCCRDDRPTFYLEGEGDERCVDEEEEEEEEEEAVGQRCSTPRGQEEQEVEAPSTGKGESTPFASLHTLCLSRTSICDVEHLQALNDFPALHSLKIMDIAMFSQLHQEDRRKLYVASVPRVKFLNGSEVTVTEKDKAERFYLRHFLEEEDKPPRYMELERKHGPVQPLFDIDLGARFQTHARLTVVLCGSEQFTETVSLIQPVGKLRRYLAERLAIPHSSFRMFHLACSPQSADERAFDELFLDSLPLSRFDFMDGDELHLDFLTGESASPTLSGIRF